MKRFIRSAILTPVTFALGVLVTVSWWHLFPRQVSLCKLARNPAAYDGKRIRVEALGSVWSSPIFVGENYLIIAQPGCAEETAALAGVRLDPDLKQNPEVDEFINSPTPEIREANLVVDGIFDEWATPGCYSPQFGIKNATVTLASPVTSKPLPEMPTRDSHSSSVEALNPKQ